MTSTHRDLTEVALRSFPPDTFGVVVCGDEMTHTSSTWRRPQGNGSPLSYSTYTARLDGREHTIPNSPSKVALKRVDANSIERTLEGEDSGKEAATWTLSADRKTLTALLTQLVDLNNEASRVPLRAEDALEHMGKST